MRDSEHWDEYVPLLVAVLAVLAFIALFSFAFWFIPKILTPYYMNAASDWQKTHIGPAKLLILEEDGR